MDIIFHGQDILDTIWTLQATAMAPLPLGAGIYISENIFSNHEPSLQPLYGFCKKTTTICLACAVADLSMLVSWLWPEDEMSTGLMSSLVVIEVVKCLLATVQ